ncbi:MAG: hypothetical protein IKD70_06990 [Eggerthellaceae bacterium]|nr:hypothetical protein [Eggerthellaceae bacterium]
MDAGIISRRHFLGGALAGTTLIGLSACSTAADVPKTDAVTLPPADPDPESMFGVDKNVNMATIDAFIASGALNNAALRDMRLADDPAHYEAIGGDSKLSMMIEGFTVVPYPYIGSLQVLPVEGAYVGPALYSVVWDDAGSIVSATSNYAQAPDLLEDLFPKDKPILLMCGGGGYAGMMRKLLVYLGWNSERIYNIGGMWDYVGKHPVQLISYADPAHPKYYLWRASMPIIDFSTLN